MSEDSLTAFGAAALLMLFGAGGLLLPAPWNPFRLKARYEGSVSPGFANAIPKVVGISFILLGLVAVAVGVVTMMP